MKRVLLTGASGFVGSHVLRHFLVNTDWDIVCPVTFTHKGIQDRIRVATDGIEDAFKRVKVIKTDLTAPVSPVTAAIWGRIDYVVNVASDSHVKRSIDDPATFILNNVGLICHLLDWARTQPSIEKIIQVSTDEVYGPAEAGYEHKEWVDLHLPSNPYAASKAAQEDICFAYWRTYGLPIAITNTMNIVGETQDSEKYVPMIIKKIFNNEVVTVHGNAETGEIGSRYFLHARNQADGLLFVLSQPFPKYGESSVPEKWNIVGKDELTNLEIAQEVARCMNRELKYEIVDFNSSRPGHDLRYALSGDKMAQAGWTPPYSFSESLQKTVDWTLSHSEWLAL